MAVITPTINRIYRMNEYDLLITNKKPGNMYMCLDTRILYYDESVNRRVKYGYTGVNTRNDLFHYITPASGMTYYCWEDNSLWLWNNKWIALYTDGSYPSAYMYDDNRNILDLYNGNEPNTVLDNNGLLKDGSVVIRDRNRIIKGKVYIEDSNDNLIVSSFLGGGIRFLPNGKMTGNGELFIGDVPRIDPETGEAVINTVTGETLYDTKATIKAQFSILNNEGYIDYSEVPDEDPVEYPNSEHKYTIFHEGNLDVSAIKVITPQDIYSKLQDPSLPSPLNLNVSSISGKTVDDIALIGHKHVATDITDFNTTARDQALVQINDVFTRMQGEGITVSYNSTSRLFKMSANPFTLTFTGGVAGSALVNKLSDTTITLSVNPSGHIHQNYVDTMNNLQDQINSLITIDPENYYNKTQIDNKLSDVTATDIPTAGKPIKVNNNLIIPVTSQATNSLANPIDITLQGDITGTVNTNLGGNVSITTSASNIVSQSPTQGKALLVDSNGDLPGNAQTATRLNHTLRLLFTGEVSGTADIDTSLNQNIVSLTLDPGNNIVQSSDLGVTVATLGSDGKLTPSQLPASQSGLVPKGNWNPTTGAPSNTPIDGQFWIADTEGTFNNKLFQIGDWCLWYNSEWNKIDTNDNVLSVNGNTGAVTLTASDVGAIDTSYLNYTLGNTIPQNKVVLTSQNGIIEGASVSNLTNSFNLLTDSSGDIIIDTSGSTAYSTDGSSDLNVKLMITNDGYDNILDQVGLVLKRKGTILEHKPNLNFGEGLDVVVTNNDVDVSITPGPFKVLQMPYNISGDDKTDFELELTDLYNNRQDQPILLIVNEANDKYSVFKIDSNCPNMISGNNITITSYINQSNDIVVDNNTNEFSISNKLRQITLEFGNIDPETIGIIDITLTDKTNLSPKYLATNANVDGTTSYYTPTYDCQPTTKKYVDDNINSYRKNHLLVADNTTLIYTYVHNMNSENILVQLWDTVTKKIDNTADITIVDNNTITIEFTSPITNDINLVILK